MSDVVSGWENICGLLSEDGDALCALAKGHEGPCGWAAVDLDVVFPLPEMSDDRRMTDIVERLRSDLCEVNDRYDAATEIESWRSRCEAAEAALTNLLRATDVLDGWEGCVDIDYAEASWEPCYECWGCAITTAVEGRNKATDALAATGTSEQPSTKLTGENLCDRGMRDAGGVSDGPQ